MLIFDILVSSDGVFTLAVGGSTSNQKSKSKTNKSDDANVPSQRMKPGLAICKGSLYLFGGEFESGSKQYTLNDFYSLGILCPRIGFSGIFLKIEDLKRNLTNIMYLYSIDLHKLDEWKTIVKQDLAACEVMESDDESGSETGSDEDDDDSDDSDSDDDDSDMDTD